jgi:HCOMODA/2-hydroxy-3-carboxy-muconic semialdehyde decarboxylase
LNVSKDLLDDLVSANHILVKEGVFDGFGHVSVRHESRPDRFLISRSLPPSMVQAEDILECDLEGNVHDAQDRKSYLERFIHSAVYKARPDVVAVIHSHSPAIIPFGVTGARLRPICHMSGFLGSNVPTFEIRDTLGETSDMLIRNQSIGESLADTLGNNAVALLRGHGNVVVANSIQLAVFRAYYTEGNAKLQADAMRMSFGMGASEPIYLSEDEARNSAETNAGQVERPWSVWKSKLPV